MQSKKSFLRTSILSDRQQFGRISVTEEQWATISAAEEIVSSLETNERHFFISGITIVEWQRITHKVEMIIASDERGRLYEEHPQFNFSNMHRGINIKIAKACRRQEIRRQADMRYWESREVKFDEEGQLALR